MNDFAVFILTHGRPDKVLTYTTLQRQHYTGKVYIIIDNEDPAKAQYYQKFGDQVIEFNKRAIAATFDECDNFRISRKSVVYARNACFDIARGLGVTYFLQLDDDYHSIEYRFDKEYRWRFSRVPDLDKLFAAVLEFYKRIPALTIALAQGGDLIGGSLSSSLKTFSLKRKAMNSFFCSTERPFQFIGRLNEDVTMYTLLGSRGNLIFTIYNANIAQMGTQEHAGGMTDIYKDAGTYVKSFYSVMNSPSFVKVASMGEQHRRIHHRIDWPHAVPVIISERHRKA